MFSNFHSAALGWLVPHSDSNTDTHSLLGGQMFNNLPAASSKEWMLQAGVVDQDLNLIRKVR